MNSNVVINNLKYYLEKIIGITSLTCMIIFLCNMGNEMYETLKNIWAAKALFMFTLFMFFIQRVRLLNWQTLVVSLLYLPLAYQYRIQNILLPDIFNRDRVVVWIAWLVLLIVVDMIVYHKINPLQNFNSRALLIYALMSISMIFYRNGRTHPIIFVLFFIFYLIPIDRLTWYKILNQFCTSWLIAFFIMLYRSIKENPTINLEVGRWFGAFLNIGDFGLFISCVFTIVIFKLYQTNKKIGWKNIIFVFYALCLLPIIWTALRVSTITMFIGILFIFLMGYILLFGKRTLYNVFLRLTCCTLIICVLVLIGFLSLYLLSNTDKDYWYNVMLNGNTFLKPIANLIHRAHYMFDEARTFASSNVFTPGSLINYIDLFTSGRLSIIVSFAQYFNFAGNTSVGVQVGNYYAYNTHNSYAQMIFEYGYIGGGAFILWLFYSTVASMKQYIRQHRTVQILLCLWMAMTLGVFLGERVNLYAPIVICTLFLTYPLMVKQ